MCISQGQNGVANHDRKVKTVKQVIIPEGATTDYVRMNDKLAAGDWSKKKQKQQQQQQKKTNTKNKTKQKQQTSDIEKLYNYQLLPQGFSLLYGGLVPRLIFSSSTHGKEARYEALFSHKAVGTITPKFHRTNFYRLDIHKSLGQSTHTLN